MTHDELLARLKIRIDPYNQPGSALESQHPAWLALRAVVELHKPKVTTMQGEPICGCAYGAWTFYPCPTIQAITDNLK